MIYVDDEKCAGCGVCEDVCPLEAVRVSDGVARIDQDRCNECQACVEACPNEAILMVIEPAEEKAISLREQPAPETALAEPHRSKVMPVVGAALAFLGREVAPRLATYLMNALDRWLSHQPTSRQASGPLGPQAQGLRALTQEKRAQDVAATSPTNNLTPRGSGRDRQRGRPRRHRRRGK